MCRSIHIDALRFAPHGTGLDPLLCSADYAFHSEHTYRSFALSRLCKENYTLGKCIRDGSLLHRNTTRRSNPSTATVLNSSQQIAITVPSTHPFCKDDSVHTRCLRTPPTNSDAQRVGRRFAEGAYGHQMVDCHDLFIEPTKRF